MADLVAAGLLATRQPTVLVDGRRGRRRRHRHRPAGRAQLRTRPRDRVGGDDARRTATASTGASTTSPTPTCPRHGRRRPTSARQDVVASSSGGYADVLGPVRPEQHPYAAFDDSVFTSWVDRSAARPDRAVDRGPLRQPGRGRAARPHLRPVRRVRAARSRVTTDDGEVEAGVDVQGSARGVELPAGETTSLRITLSDVRGKRYAGAAGRREPGGPGGTPLAAPARSGRRRHRRPPVRRATASCLSAARTRTVVRAVAPAGDTGDDPASSAPCRSSEPGAWQVAGRAVATNGGDLERLFAPLDPRRVAVSATSTYAGDPAVVGARAYDGRRGHRLVRLAGGPGPGTRPDLAAAADDPLGHRRCWTRDSRDGCRLALLVDPLNGDDPQLVATSGPDAGTLEPVRTDRLRVAASGGTGTRASASPSSPSRAWQGCGTARPRHPDRDRVRVRPGGGRRWAHGRDAGPRHAGRRRRRAGARGACLRGRDAGPHRRRPAPRRRQPRRASR